MDRTYFFRCEQHSVAVVDAALERCDRQARSGSGFASLTSAQEAVEMTDKRYVLLLGGRSIEIDENEPPTKRRALPLCYHLFGRDEPPADDKPLSET